jgi:hypothetical protein
MQALLQLTRPAWQLSEQVPPLQTWPSAQAIPAPPSPFAPHPLTAPQYVRSELGLTHPPLQFTKPVWQLSWQLPEEQTLPAGHAVPALPWALLPHPLVAPQYVWLDVGSMQAPLQITNPV